MHLCVLQSAPAVIYCTFGLMFYFMFGAFWSFCNRPRLVWSDADTKLLSTQVRMTRFDPGPRSLIYLCLAEKISYVPVCNIP